MQSLESTIIAIASPPGRSARGIVRLSGSAAFQCLAPLVQRTADHSTRGVHVVRLHLPFGTLPVLLLAFPGPRSYTGEDAIEMQLPGNPVLLDRAMRAVIDAGRARGIDIREAEPGEFTARAYFNGRLSLTEAEGVAATISARSDAELRAASWMREGSFGRRIAGFADDLAGALALVEAGIDFTDQDDVVAISARDLTDRLKAIRSQIEALLARAVPMEQLQAIPWVVLRGPPNVGKSTLFNALLGRDRAVVSDVAGTTRDVLAEPLTIDTEHGPAEVMLVDLAGLDDDLAEMNQRMQALAQDAMARAELILHCDAGGESGDVAGAARRAAHIRVRTKTDLCVSCIADEDALGVSGVTGAGLEALRCTIAERLADRAVSLAADAVALQPRHESRLREARASVTEAIDQLLAQPGRRAIEQPELIASSIRAALDSLGMLVGAITPDDILGRVFAAFCVGK